MDEQREKKDPIEVVAAAIAAVGEDTAATIATRAGIAYSTVTPKLRALEAAGRAERFRRDGQTLWRLTAAVTPDPDHADRPEGPEAASQVATVPDPDGADREQSDPPHTGSAPATAGAVDSDIRLDSQDAADPATPTPAEADTAAGGTDAATEPPNHGDHAGPQPATAEADAAPTAAAAGNTRRPPGELGRTALRIMQQNPQTAYKVGDMAKLINKADEGKGYPNASPGAVVLALNTLAGNGTAKQVSDKPATYQLA